MENKGINTLAHELNEELTQTINKYLNSMPPVLLFYILQNALTQVDRLCERVREMEKQQAETRQTDKEKNGEESG